MRSYLAAAFCSIAVVATVSYIAYQGYHKKQYQSPTANATVTAVVTSPQITTTSQKPESNSAFTEVKKPVPVIRPVASRKSHPEKNEFVYYPDKKETFTAKQGTRISFPSNAFVDAQTHVAVQGPVDIKLEEYYRLDDILLAGLHTNSNNGLLETNGMIRVQATRDGRRCELDKGVVMQVSFPKVNDQPGMQLFYKEEHSANDVWLSLEDTARLTSSIRNNGITRSITPTLKRGLTGLKTYLNEHIEAPRDVAGAMKIEFCVTEWGSTENIKILNELNADATAQVGLALSKLNWQRGYLNSAPARYRATIELEFKQSQRSISKVTFIKPFEIAPAPATLRDPFYFNFTSPSLGWLNCDRFLQLASMEHLIVSKNPGDSLDVKMIFHKYRAVLSSVRNTDGIGFYNIPPFESVTLLAIKKINGQLACATLETSTSAGSVGELQYKMVSTKEIREIITNIAKAVSKPANNTTAGR